MRRTRLDQTTIWVGYADFLTALAILFFVFAAVYSAQLKAGVLAGTVFDGPSGLPVPECLVRVSSLDGNLREVRSDSLGEFDLRYERLREPLPLEINAWCRGIEDVDTFAAVAPGLRTTFSVRVGGAVRGPSENVIVVEERAGEELFERNGFELRAGAIPGLLLLGRRLKDGLSPDELIAIQGHTDDQSFRPGVGKDNWTLSAERAVAVARVFTDPELGVGLDESQVVVMAFGPSRPRCLLSQGDPIGVKEDKRRMNRRIELRKLKGADLTGAPGEGASGCGF